MKEKKVTSLHFNQQDLERAHTSGCSLLFTGQTDQHIEEMEIMRTYYVASLKFHAGNCADLAGFNSKVRLGDTGAVIRLEVTDRLNELLFWCPGFTVLERRIAILLINRS